jgi:tRNA pseudouridine55 synthase
MISGWLLIDKPQEVTSTKVVCAVRRLVGQKKVGHAGTLDPFATGVLPIAVGRATRTIEYLVGQSKEYVFTIAFGEQRDTGDTEGRAIETCEYIPSQQELEAAIPSFTGEIDQVPHKFSAIKVNGVRAHALAREGKQVELKSRKITIYDLNLLSFDVKKKEATLRVSCSKGTYVRSLTEDLSRKLGSLGYTKSLRRTRVGKFTEKDIISLDNLKKMVHNGELKNYLMSVDIVLDDIPVLEVTQELAEKISFGQSVTVVQGGISGIAQAKYSNKLIAVGEMTDGFFKPTKVFNSNN